MTANDIVIELVEALAAIEGVSPIELPFSLTDHIDPVVLQRVVAEGSNPERLTFTVADHRVTVFGSGEFVIDGADPTASSLSVRELPEATYDGPGRLLTAGTRAPFETGMLGANETLPDLCFVLDEEGRYRDILAKPGRADLLYASPSELLDSTVHEMLPGPEARTIADAIDRTLEEDEPVAYSYELPVENGSREFAARSRPIEESTDDPCVLLTVSDVTDEQEIASRLSN